MRGPLLQAGYERKNPERYALCGAAHALQASCFSYFAFNRWQAESAIQAKVIMDMPRRYQIITLVWLYWGVLEEQVGRNA